MRQDMVSCLSLAQALHHYKNRGVFFGELLFYFLHLAMDGRNRADVKPGMLVNIILKKDQRTGNLTEGIVKDLLTSSSYHSRGIKVRLTDGQIGRVAEIIEDDL